jgi:hypothetical protein
MVVNSYSGALGASCAETVNAARASTAADSNLMFMTYIGLYHYFRLFTIIQRYSFFLFLRL